MNDMLARSPLACYSLPSFTGTYICVCYQDKSGNIKQTCQDNSGSWHPSPKGIIGRANLNNGIAITGWANGNEERVYYVGEDDTIVERCWSSRKSRWNDGELTGKFTVAHYSNLAVLSFDLAGIWRIRVYYQGKDNTIREFCKDGEEAWTAGHSFPTAIAGTTIAAMSIVDKPRHYCLFYQKPDTTFVQFSMHDYNDWFSCRGCDARYYDGFSREGFDEWKIGNFKSQLRYEPGAYITCASDGQGMHRVFTIDRDNQLCVTEGNNFAASWTQTEQLTMTIPSSPAAATNVISPATAANAIHALRIRVYIQISPGQISEWDTNASPSLGPLPTN